MDDVEQLPKGRHGLSREEVESSQRRRILRGMAEAVRERGYVDTTVADVIARAGVSRESFYRLFSSKGDCFAAAFDAAAEVLLARITASGGGVPSEPLDRAEHAITSYLQALADEPAWARLFIVEVHAAGPEALARRFAVQDRFVDGLARILGAAGEAERFAIQLTVAAMSALVSRPLLEGDVAALRALGPPVVRHLRRTWPALRA